MPRALWVKAPLALARHPVGLLAIVASSLVLAMGAAAAPLLNARAESEALANKLGQLTPLGAGLTIERAGSPIGGADADRSRRLAFVALARTLPGVGAPVLTTTSVAQAAATPLQQPDSLIVIPMARTAAASHVHRLAGDGRGAWLASSFAQLAGVRAGETLRLVPPQPAPPGSHEIRLHVGGIYTQLDADLSNPYWVNFVSRIRAPNPDSHPPPTFLLVDQETLYRVARAVGAGGLGNVFEAPIDAHGLTPARARKTAQAFAAVRRELATRSPLARRLGCASGCSVTSSLINAVALAEQVGGPLQAVLSALAVVWALVALASAVVAGAFVTRRRAVEARLSLVLGERRSAFAARSAIEAAVPAALGTAGGVGLAALLVRSLTPAGAVDPAVYRRAALLAVLAAVASICAVAVGAAAARGDLGVRHRHWARIRRIPWEVPVAGAAVISWVVASSIGALGGGSQPRLAVLFAPMLLAAAVAGVVTRAGRSAVRNTGASAPTAVFLALRRLAAARGLAVLLAVAVAVGGSALAVGQVLRASLVRSSVEKAYVANGSDVQGLVDSNRQVPATFPFPATVVSQAYDAGTLESGRAFELITVEPRSLRAVAARRWPRELVRAVDKLDAAHANVPAIAVGVPRGVHDVAIDGRPVRVDVVATVRAFPGMLSDRPLLVVRTADLAAPAGALSYVWATGPPRAVERALARSILAPSYMTTLADFVHSADVTTVTRTYEFVRILGLALVVLAMFALPLLLHARARTQRVTSALLQRMGMSRRAQAASVALETAALVGVATLVGIVCGLAAAGGLAGRIDPLPQYAPQTAAIVPWGLLVASATAVVTAGALVGAIATLTVRRHDVGEALRVA